MAPSLLNRISVFFLLGAVVVACGTATPTRLPATQTPTETVAAAAVVSPTWTGTPTTTASATRTRTPSATFTLTLTQTETSTPTWTAMASPRPTLRPVTLTPTLLPTQPPAPTDATILLSELKLCDPAKTLYGVGERICFKMIIRNLSFTEWINYQRLGVTAVGAAGGTEFHTSWSGRLQLGPRDAGPTGFGWEDGMALSASGAYQLLLSIEYSDGRWEHLTAPIEITVQ